MFYGFAEMANWRPFRHFTKSGKSLKTVDATHPHAGLLANTFTP
jgi:hypothetical protein